MGNMEKEPKIEKSLEEKPREKKYKIERARLPEDNPIQCDMCADEDNNFQFYQEGWFVQGDFYCSKHKEGVIKVLEEVDKDAERMKLELGRIDEERQREVDQVKKEWAKQGDNLELREKLAQKSEELKQKRKGKGV